MKIIPYNEVKAVHFNNDAARGVAARVVIGRQDGAENFCMRVYKIAPGGNTPKHVHDWEHEMFIHSGNGQIYADGQWNAVKSGDAAFIPAKVEHQIRNPGWGFLTVVCLVPSTAPEL